MKKSIVSAKYQVVIPPELRRKYHIEPGQSVRMTEKHGDIVIETDSKVEELVQKYARKGGGAGLAADLAAQKDEWEKHQAAVDALWD